MKENDPVQLPFSKMILSVTGNIKKNTQILYTRLRTKCSSLNNKHFFSWKKKKITEFPLCPCGQLEDSHYYLLCCPFYTAQRNEHFIVVLQYQTILLNFLLFGASLPDTTNVLMVEKKVQNKVSETKLKLLKLFVIKGSVLATLDLKTNWLCEVFA